MGFNKCWGGFFIIVYDFVDKDYFEDMRYGFYVVLSFVGEENEGDIGLGFLYSFIDRYFV